MKLYAGYGCRFQKNKPVITDVFVSYSRTETESYWLPQVMASLISNGLAVACLCVNVDWIHLRRGQSEMGCCEHSNEV
jgi:hypothetical protein